jgi:NADH:ubiquinone oxidoreductase subunit F (NADH-binding)
VSAPVLVRPAGDGGGPVVAVQPGAHVLRDVSAGPSLAEHRRRTPPPPALPLGDLVARVRDVDVRGRGGAGFPFAAKLEATAGAGRRREVVVNLSEGEPVSFKDAALALTRPHLVLDGAVLAARALGSRVVHVVLPGDRAGVAAAVRRAVDERGHEEHRIRWRVHRAEGRFVAGQAHAVVELMSGRPNLPVTGWQPVALHGYRGRPTLLSNAETFAHVALLAGQHRAAYAGAGTDEEPGTRLLTLDGDGEQPTVTEVAHGTPWEDLLTDEALDGPVLVGGYHGTWAAPGALRGLTVSRTAMAGAGLSLGAGVVLPLVPGDCPVHRTAGIVAYLAGQSARRCGPCRHGLPALADAVRATDRGIDLSARAGALAGLVTGRGACAHPDGTARTVTSMLAAFGEEVAAHASGGCGYRRSSRVARSVGSGR